MEEDRWKEDQLLYRCMELPIESDSTEYEGQKRTGQSRREQEHGGGTGGARRRERWRKASKRMTETAKVRTKLKRGFADRDVAKPPGFILELRRHLSRKTRREILTDGVVGSGRWCG